MGIIDESRATVAIAERSVNDKYGRHSHREIFFQICHLTLYMYIRLFSY